MNPLQLDHRGFTVLECAIYTAIFTVVASAFVLFIRTTLGSISSAEARTIITRATAEIADRIQHQLTVSRRLFDNTAVGNNYLARVNVDSNVPVLTDSKLPTIQPNGILSPNSTSFITANVGNSLFFAENLGQEDLTVATSGSSRSFRIDTYRFHYYYPTPSGSVSLGGKPRLDLAEWRSIPYADASEIQNISDSTARTNIINVLVSSGVTYAWDPIQSNPSTAFYTLGSGAITLNATHQIVMDNNLTMLHIATGQTGGSFHYGLCPNTSSNFLPPDTVPLYAAALNDYPGGFEVVIVGSPNARQVLVRSVLAAQGTFKTPQSYQNVSVISVTDSW